MSIISDKKNYFFKNRLIAMNEPLFPQEDALNERTLTVDDASSILNLHPKTVCRYIREGKIRAARCGRNYRIRRQWLIDFLEANQSSVENQ